MLLKQKKIKVFKIFIYLNDNFKAIQIILNDESWENIFLHMEAITSNVLLEGEKWAFRETTFSVICCIFKTSISFNVVKISLNNEHSVKDKLMIDATGDVTDITFWMYLIQKLNNISKS